jgi:hypothetical protein
MEPIARFNVSAYVVQYNGPMYMLGASSRTRFPDDWRATTHREESRMMSRQDAVPAAGKLTVVALLVAAVGVAIQIASGTPYPTIPPAFFILLIPAAFIGLGRWWWAPILAVLSGLFLTFGLFAAGETGRLTDPKSFADSFGLWTQTVAVLVATVGGVLATRTNVRRRSSVTRG